MLFEEPHPLDFLLEETEVTAAATAAVGARAAIDLEGNLFVVSRYANATLAKETEDVVLHEHVVVVEEREFVFCEFADGVFRGL